MSRSRTLSTRMLALGLLQLGILVAAAVVIWWLYGPHGPHGVPPGGFGRGGIPASHPLRLGPLITLIVGALVLALGAVLTARWIVRPIEQLTRTVRALGEGDLGARSGVTRADEIGELGRRFDEMAQRIEGLLAAERELLANVAHELLTPLARIDVALDLAGEGDAARARESLAEISVDVAELRALVDDVLLAMRLDLSSGNPLPLERSRMSPASLADAAVERLRVRHPTRGFAVEAEPGLPDVDVDARLFRRILDNLLENAHKYSPDAATTVELTVHATGGDVRFEVADRGIGIAPTDLDRVFEAFFRGERSRSRRTGGVGLGLTLAKRLVEVHDGSIAIANRADGGTLVEVRVPALPARKSEDGA